MVNIGEFLVRPTLRNNTFTLCHNTSRNSFVFKFSSRGIIVYTFSTQILLTIIILLRPDRIRVCLPAFRLCLPAFRLSLHKSRFLMIIIAQDLHFSALIDFFVLKTLKISCMFTIRNSSYLILPLKPIE